jgi:hypothetical protein
MLREFGIASTAALKDKLLKRRNRRKTGRKNGAQHVREGLQEVHNEMLHYEAETIVAAVKAYLKQQCGIRKAERDYRRRVEIIRKIPFLVESL